MEIAVDYREVDLLKCLQANYPPSSERTIVSQNLAVGDVVITRPDGERLFVERKTLKDLSASIRDGRYKEQSQRLLSASPRPELVFYLIEGTWGKYPRRSAHYLPKSTLVSALFSLSTEKRFSTHRTDDCAESAEWIASVAAKFARSEVNSSPQAGEGIIIKRSGVITRDNIEQVMLSQVPGVSVRIASTLTKEFGGLAGLLEAVRADTEKLGEVRIPGIGGKTRKIPSNCVKNLVSLLGGE